MNNLVDQLSWSEFYNNSKNRKKIPTKLDKYNRLIAHTKNLFVISGYGAFTPGYFLIISKEFIPSFGLIQKKNLNELNFLINFFQNIITNELDRKSVVFEHGMCACIGGLDRAHLHIMSIPKSSSEKSITKAINNSLYKRKAGINYIKYNNYKLDNLHDINHIYEDLMVNKVNKSKFKISGKIFKIKDIKNLNYDKWPLITLDHIKKGKHYVYFKSDFKNSSFLTTKNFQTQFGRQIAFENEMILNLKYKKNINKLKTNELTEIWKWQDFMFGKNVLMWGPR